MLSRRQIGELVGKTLTSIVGAHKESESIVFTCSDGSEYIMYHEDECRESVSVEDVCGDVGDLLGVPIDKAEESQNDSSHPNGFVPEYEPQSFTWTFYHLATINGYVTIRWYGTSNGYYSEDVALKQTKKAVAPRKRNRKHDLMNHGQS